MLERRELNFYKVPRSELVAEVLDEFREAYEMTIPEMEIPGVSDEQKALLLEQMLNNSQDLRFWVEAGLRKRYRLPDDILPEDIVDAAENDRITSVIKQVDAFAEGITKNFVGKGWGGPQNVGYIYLQNDHPESQLSWLGIPLEGRIRRFRDRAANRIMGFTGFLDTEHFDDYCDPVGKGFDLFLLARDYNGDIGSYHVRYKGEGSPQTPWDYMHKADLPVIQAFIASVQERLAGTKGGSARIGLDEIFV